MLVSARIIPEMYHVSGQRGCKRDAALCGALKPHGRELHSMSSRRRIWVCTITELSQPCRRRDILTITGTGFDARSADESDETSLEDELGGRG